MVKYDKLKTALRIRSRASHYLERLSNGVHVFVPQLGLRDVLVFLIFGLRRYALGRVHLARLVMHEEGRDRRLVQLLSGDKEVARFTELAELESSI
jgi:hypothetical protein